MSKKERKGTTVKLKTLKQNRKSSIKLSYSRKKNIMHTPHEPHAKKITIFSCKAIDTDTVIMHCCKL